MGYKGVYITQTCFPGGDLSEINISVETFKEIQDSVCVSQVKKDGSEERVILFLRVAPGSEFTDTLVSSVKMCIRQYLSARHVPSLVLPINDIPVSYISSLIP